MSRETNIVATEGYIISLETEIQQKIEVANNMTSDNFLPGVEIGLLVEEQEMWKKRLAELKVA